VNEPICVDSDVWIDFLRGAPEAKAFVAQLPEVVHISAVSVAELYVGVRQGKERKALEALIATLAVLPLDEATATIGGLWRRDFGPSHGVGLNDALIAASAHSIKATLFTHNTKHYPMLSKTACRRPYILGK
jgi:predicted nucleic acid-binding protein